MSFGLIQRWDPRGQAEKDEERMVNTAAEASMSSCVLSDSQSQPTTQVLIVCCLV